jgi:hypothetical protein
MRRYMVIAGALLVAALLLSLTAGQVSARPAGAETNLLTNPSFEAPFIPDWRDDGGGFVAHGWRAWWVNTDTDDLQGPEYKQANIAVDPYRVRTGRDAQQYFRPWTRHLAGLYQRVTVPANSRLRFTIYGHAWSSFCRGEADNLECDARDSTYGGANPITMKIGIDPTGGTDPFSDRVVWSPGRAVYDIYDLFTVEAAAQGSTVTVYVYSNPLWAAPVVNVYWDDAALVVITGTGGAATRTPTPARTPTGAPPSGGARPGGAPGGYIGVVPRQTPLPTPTPNR